MFKGESYKQGGGIMSNVGGVELEEFKDAKWVVLTSPII